MKTETEGGVGEISRPYLIEGGDEAAKRRDETRRDARGRSSDIYLESVLLSCVFSKHLF